MALAPFRAHAEDQREKPVKSSLIPVLPPEQRGLSQRIASRASPRYGTVREYKSSSQARSTG